MVESSIVSALRGSENALSFEDIFFKGSFIDIASIFQSPYLFGTVFILSIEEVVASLFFPLSMQYIISEKSSVNNIIGHIHSLSISSSELDLTLIVVTVCVDEPSIAIGQASCE